MQQRTECSSAATAPACAHSAVELAPLDLTCRATKTRLINAVAPKPLRAQVKPMWLLAPLAGRSSVEVDEAAVERFRVK